MRRLLRYLSISLVILIVSGCSFVLPEASLPKTNSKHLVEKPNMVGADKAVPLFLAIGGVVILTSLAASLHSDWEANPEFTIVTGGVGCTFWLTALAIHLAAR